MKEPIQECNLGQRIFVSLHLQTPRQSIDLKDFDTEEEMKLFKMSLQSFAMSKFKVVTFKELVVSTSGESTFEVLEVYKQAFEIIVILMIVELEVEGIEGMKEPNTTMVLDTMEANRFDSMQEVVLLDFDIEEFKAYYTQIVAIAVKSQVEHMEAKQSREGKLCHELTINLFLELSKIHKDCIMDFTESQRSFFPTQ